MSRINGTNHQAKVTANENAGRLVQRRDRFIAGFNCSLNNFTAYVIISPPPNSFDGVTELKATVARVFLRRLNDPANEYRRLEVLQDDDSKFLLFESTLFASDPEAQRIALTNIDSQSVILEQIWREIDHLQTEGFALVRKEGRLLGE